MVSRPEPPSLPAVDIGVGSHLSFLDLLVKGKLFAEVDRVWTIQPSPISQPVIYVLECKGGLVRK